MSDISYIEESPSYSQDTTDSQYLAQQSYSPDYSNKAIDQSISMDKSAQKTQNIADYELNTASYPQAYPPPYTQTYLSPLTPNYPPPYYQSYSQPYQPYARLYPSTYQQPYQPYPPTYQSYRQIYSPSYVQPNQPYTQAPPPYSAQPYAQSYQSYTQAPPPYYGQSYVQPYPVYTAPYVTPYQTIQTQNPYQYVYPAAALLGGLAGSIGYFSALMRR